MEAAPCAGVVMASTNWKVAVVYTKRGWASFPKGKRKAGEGVREAAIRECKEEIGVVPDSFISEYLLVPEESASGEVIVACYVAVQQEEVELGARDGDDIVRSEWVPLDRLLSQKWRSKRYQVVRQVHRLLMALKTNHREDALIVADAALCAGTHAGIKPVDRVNVYIHSLGPRDKAPRWCHEFIHDGRRALELESIERDIPAFVRPSQFRRAAHRLEELYRQTEHRLPALIWLHHRVQKALLEAAISLLK